MLAPGQTGNNYFVHDTWTEYNIYPPLIVLSSDPGVSTGIGEWVRYFGGNYNNIPINVVEVSYNSYIELTYLISEAQALNESLMIYVASGEFNPWSQQFDSWVNIFFYSVMLGIISLFLVIWAAYKLYLFIRINGISYSVPIVLLIIQIIINTIRMVIFMVDPIFSRRIFSNLANNVLITFPLPITIMSVLLICFYWIELLRKSKLKRPPLFLDKLQIPYWIFFVAIMAGELTSSILRGLGSSLTIKAVAIISYIYFALTILLVILFFYVGIKLFLDLKSSNRKFKSNTGKRLIRTTKVLLSSIFGQILYALALMIISTTTYYYQPWGFWFLNTTAYIGEIWVSLMIIIGIHPPTKDKTETRNTTATVTVTKNRNLTT